MNNELKTRTELYNKIQNEYNNFIENLKQQTPTVILDKAYEKVMKEETVYMFYPESEKFTIEQIKALNKTRAPLDELYQGWMRSDVNLNELYEDNVYDTLDNIVEEQRKEKNKKANIR